MARGQRKSIDEKIQQKKEIISSIETRLEHEKKELEELLIEKEKQEVKILNDFIKTSGISVYEAAELLQKYVTEQYEDIA